jgi:DNA-binding transcriptional MerR regulator
MYKIGDFSQLGQVSVRMLRHYDQLGLLKPGYVDRFTSYRYYTAEQLPRLNRILALRDLGFSLEEVAAQIEDNLPPAQLHALLCAKQREIEQQMADEAARLQRVTLRLRRLEQEGTPPRYEVATKTLPAQTLISVRSVVPTIPDMATLRCEQLALLYAGLAEAGITPGLEMAIYHLQEYDETNIDMLLGVIVQGALPKRLPPALRVLHLPAAPLAAGIVHRGAFAEVADVIPALYRWAGEHRYTSAGPNRELHIFGRELEIFDHAVDHDVVFEVQLPIEPLPLAPA